MYSRYAHANTCTMEIKSYLCNIIQYKSYTKLIPISQPIPATLKSFNSNANSCNMKCFNSNSGIGVVIAATGPNPAWGINRVVMASPCNGYDVPETY